MDGGVFVTCRVHCCCCVCAAGQCHDPSCDSNEHCFDIGAGDCIAGLASCDNECFVERVESASSVSHTAAAWIGGGGMVLNPARFRFWGMCPAGAAGQVTWTWDKETGMPPRSDTPNHKSAMLHAALLGSQLDDAAAMGMIEYYNKHQHGSVASFAHNILPLGARMKPSGAVRMLVDPSLPGVNGCMQALPCPLPTIEQVFKAVQPHHVLGKRDLLNGFFHLVLAPEARRHMAFRHPGTGLLARWVVLPQGTKQSPALFCAVSSAAAEIFNRKFTQQGIRARTIVYVDDFIIIADSHPDMVAAFAAMDDEAALLGLMFNPAKDIGRDQALTSIEALGLVIDAPAQELRLPADKRNRYSQELSSFLTKHSLGSNAPRKEVESLVGKLLYACRACRWGYLFVQELLDCLYPAADSRTPTVFITEGAMWDLQFWQHVLVADDSKWLGVRKHMLGTRECDVNPALFNTTIYTDASKTFGAGGVLNSEIYSAAWGTQHSRDAHIGTLELQALADCLKHWKHDLAQQTVLARMDNVQAVSAINKGASRVPALRPILLEIALLGIEFGFEVKAKHIAGELNPADAPSRGQRSNVSSDWTFTEFTRFNTPPAEIDCCAAESGYNVQPGCTTWFSMARPVQQHVDQLVGRVLWANAPFSQVGLVLDAIVEAWTRDPANTVATVLVPEWTTANWYRKYLRRKRPLFRVLHRYPAGAQIFRWKDSIAPAPPTKFPMLVMRIGQANPHTN